VPIKFLKEYADPKISYLKMMIWTIKNLLMQKYALLLWIHVDLEN